MAERTVLVSSDIAGGWQRLRTASEVYEEVMPEIDGIEAICARGGSFCKIDEVIRHRIAEARDLGFEQVNLHGRTRSNRSNLKDWLKIRLIDSLIIPTELMIEAFGAKHEILIHSTEVGTKGVVSKLMLHQNELKGVWIENDHSGVNAVKHAIRVVDLQRNNGVKCSMMLDICHGMGARTLANGNYRKGWEPLREFMIDNPKLFKTDNNRPPIIQGFHLSIDGGDKSDSVQLANTYTRKIMSDIGCFMESCNFEGTIVFERQNGAVARGYSNRELLELQTSVGRTFELANDCDIISLS